MVLVYFNSMAITTTQKGRLREKGLWDKYLQIRERLKGEGVKPAEAAKRALAEIETIEREEWEPNSKVSELLAQVPKIPDEVTGRVANEVENIRWVYNHIVPGTDLSGCPSAGAWLEVFLCRMSGPYLQTFMDRSRSKLIPSRAQLVNEEDVGPMDGTATVEFLKKVRAITKKQKKSVADGK